MPNPERHGSTYYLRVRTPGDVADAAKGTLVAVPIGDTTVTAKVGDVVKLSLRTKDAVEAKRRFTQALAAVDAHWEALRRGPSKLSHRDCVALAREVRAVWVALLDENPGEAEMWIQALQRDADATKPKPHPMADLFVGEPPSPSNKRGMEQRFGGFADAVLRRHALVVDEETRTRLLPLIATAMGEANRVNLKKAQGDYSDSGETNKYPEFREQTKAGQEARTPPPAALNFNAIIDMETRRRSLGKESKPLPERTERKYRNAAADFAAFRGDDNAHTVSTREADAWMLDMLEAGELSSGTIAQRLQNLCTIMEWGQKRTYGELYTHINPVALVERPQKNGVKSEDRTLRLDEARAILREARTETEPTLRWLPWMMAYSGARVSEVAQLQPRDFFQLEEQWFYVLTTKGKKSLKNDHSIRKVPVHPDLISEGLLEFVEARKGAPGSRLFKKSAQQDLSVWVRDKAGVTRTEAAPNHGWRHLFEDMALDGGMLVTAKSYVTGRASGRSADGYGKSDAMLPGLAREMGKIRSYLPD